MGTLENELVTNIQEMKKGEWEEIYMILKYGLSTYLKSFMVFGKNHEVTKDSLALMKEYLSIVLQERKIFNFMLDYLPDMDLDKASVFLEELDSVNDKTIFHFYDVIDNTEDAIEMNNAFRARRPKRKFETICSSPIYQRQAISLVENVQSIQFFLALGEKFEEYINERIKFADVSQDIAEKICYVRPVSDKYGRIVDIMLMLPVVHDLESAHLFITLYLQAFGLYSYLNAFDRDGSYSRSILEEYKQIGAEKYILYEQYLDDMANQLLSSKFSLTKKSK